MHAEVDPDRQVEGMQAHSLEPVRELLDARFVLHGREGIILARFPGERILAVLAVNPVQVLGLHVVRLEVVVAERPFRRESARVTRAAEVGGIEPEERRTVDLRVATHVVVELGPKGLVVDVVKGLLGNVAVVGEDLFGVPVRAFPLQEVAALEQEHAFAGLRQFGRSRSATGPASDHDDVVVVALGCRWVAHFSTNRCFLRRIRWATSAVQPVW
jgi:hypothetical protein